MIKHSEAIVLRTLRHQDNHLIATLYTLESGICSFIIKGYRSSRSRKKHSYFQPLSIIDIVYFYKESRQIQQVNESRLSYLIQHIQTDPVKLSLGLAMIEVFYHCVKEEESNPPLFHFLKDLIIRLDQSPQHNVHLFVFFLVHLTRYLGFFPHDASEGKKKIHFDLEGGTLYPVEGQGDPVALLLKQFMDADPVRCQEIRFDTFEKRHLIKTLFDYYLYHIEGFKYPQTLKVFAEVFGGE